MKKVILIEILPLNKKDKRNFDVDYEASRIQAFISQFKDNKNKELKDEKEKLKL